MPCNGALSTQRALIGSSACMGGVIGLLAGAGLWMNHDSQVRRIWPMGGLVCGILGGIITYNILRTKRNHYLSTCSLDPMLAYESKNSVDMFAKDKVKPVSFSDIIGLDTLLGDIKEMVNYLKSPDKYRRVGAIMPKGILLEGPPGTGKTMIARALACETQCAFFYASASSFVEMHVGVGAKRVRELFEQARIAKPAIVFIDELDAIGAASRDIGGNEEYRQTLNELLCQLDGFEDLEDVLVIGATNNAKALDHALMRGGRFDRLISVPLLDQPGRYALLEYLRNKSDSLKVSPVFLKKLSYDTEGLTAADLKNIFSEAGFIAVREKTAMVSEEQLDRAAQKIINERCKK